MKQEQENCIFSQSITFKLWVQNSSNVTFFPFCFVFCYLEMLKLWKKMNIQKLLTMYHSTIVPVVNGVTVQGSEAFSSFNTSTLGFTTTFTFPLLTTEKNTQKRKKNKDHCKMQHVAEFYKIYGETQCDITAIILLYD